MSSVIRRNNFHLLDTGCFTSTSFVIKVKNSRKKYIYPESGCSSVAGPEGSIINYSKCPLRHFKSMYGIIQTVISRNRRDNTPIDIQCSQNIINVMFHRLKKSVNV